MKKTQSKFRMSHFANAEPPVFLVGMRPYEEAIAGVLIFVLLILGVSCSPATSLDQGLNGTWESVGYGWILEIRDSTDYAVYDVNEIACLPGRRAPFAEIGGAITLSGDTLFLKRGILTYLFTRLDTLPESCSTPVPVSRARDPLYNFDVFARNVADHYVFMDLNGVNWDILRQEQRQKIASSPADTTLYRVLGETFSILGDNHAYLEASADLYERLEEDSDDVEEAPVPSDSIEYGDFPVAAMVAKNHLSRELTQDSWLIQWGWMAEGTALVEIKAMWLYADLEIPQGLIDKKGFVDAYVETFHQMDEGRYIQMEVAGVRRIMDRVVEDLREAERIILDVRFNGGGQDAVSFEILRYFNEERRIVGLQQVKAGDSLSPVQPLCLEASETPFLNPVYILTSPQTGSAAEGFALASLSMPHVRRIGAPTSGALSTALEKQLPNGWHFSLSNELFMDADGVYYENRGIPVDYKLEYPKGRQAFFRSVAEGLEQDKAAILEAVESLGMAEN